MKKTSPSIISESRHKKFLNITCNFLLASTLLFGASSAATTVSAHSGDGNLPSHQVRGISCAGAYSSAKGIVRAFTPRYAVAWNGRSTDTVFWNPVLYRFNGTQYVQWSSLNFPAFAYVTPYGFNPNLKPGWRSSSTHNIIRSAAFTNVPPGFYKVLNQVHWVSTSVTHSEWGYNACAIK